MTSGAENVTTIYVNTVLKKTYSPTDTEMESDIGDDAIFFICNGLIKGF